jgi:hypothetical protein
MKSGKTTDLLKRRNAAVPRGVASAASVFSGLIVIAFEDEHTATKDKEDGQTGGGRISACPSQLW